MTDGILYCFDSGALITPHRYRYPIDMFPLLWDRLTETFCGGRVFLCKEAFDEIVDRGDKLSGWIEERKNQNPLLVRETLNEIWQLGTEIARANPKMAISRSGKAADPSVIAHAKIAGATVVTEENSSGNPDGQKVPNVCERMDVRCINFLEFMRDENYRF